MLLFRADFVWFGCCCCKHQHQARFSSGYFWSI